MILLIIFILILGFGMIPISIKLMIESAKFSDFEIFVYFWLFIGMLCPTMSLLVSFAILDKYLL
jgi:hypothetical protein